MEIEIKYSGKADRQVKVAENEALNYRMLHDNFDPNWKPEQEPYGILVFTDEEPTGALLVAGSLATEIDDLKARIEKLENPI